MMRKLKLMREEIYFESIIITTKVCNTRTDDKTEVSLTGRGMNGNVASPISPLILALSKNQKIVMMREACV